jgi:hypothetical protein
MVDPAPIPKSLSSRDSKERRENCRNGAHRESWQELLLPINRLVPCLRPYQECRGKASPNPLAVQGSLAYFSITLSDIAYKEIKNKRRICLTWFWQTR